MMIVNFIALYFASLGICSGFQIGINPSGVVQIGSLKHHPASKTKHDHNYQNYKSSPFHKETLMSQQYRHHPSHAFRKAHTTLHMSSSNQGPGPLTAVIIVGIIAVFIVTGVGPLFDTPGANDLNLGDSVASRQDSGKVVNYQSDFDKLSRSKIQEKLNRVPVFYLVEGNNEASIASGNIFLSYADATEAAASASLKVKATTLDQVMYPLIFKRGRMRMAPPPPAIQKAEDALTQATDDGPTTALSFKLVPSQAALKDAKEENLNLGDGDIPLFVAERLAFAGSDGPQVPLFLEKTDCITSYNRLRESNNRLAETPNLRTTTLKDILFSMEKGTRPAVSQLQFYATAEDLIRASEMM